MSLSTRCSLRLFDIFTHLTIFIRWRLTSEPLLFANNLFIIVHPKFEHGILFLFTFSLLDEYLLHARELCVSFPVDLLFGLLTQFSEGTIVHKADFLFVGTR
jgi:hypothetical protein